MWEFRYPYQQPASTMSEFDLEDRIKMLHTLDNLSSIVLKKMRPCFGQIYGHPT